MFSLLFIHHIVLTLCACVYSCHRAAAPLTAVFGGAAFLTLRDWLPLCSAHKFSGLQSTSTSVFSAPPIFKVFSGFSLSPFPRHCPRRSRPEAYLLVVHGVGMLIEMAYSFYTDILLYNIGAENERIISLQL